MGVHVENWELDTGKPMKLTGELKKRDKVKDVETDMVTE